MRAIPQAIVWETLTKGRLPILLFFVLATLFPLLTYRMTGGDFTTKHFRLDASNSAMLTLQVVFVPLIVVLFAIGVVGGQGHLSRLYWAPISNWSLVLTHMFSGALIVGLESTLGSLLFNELFDAQWPILGACLFAMAFWCSIVWLVHVGQKSFFGFCIACVPSLFLVLWLRGRYGSWFSVPKHLWSVVTFTEVCTLAVVVVICSFGAFLSVRKDRCGEPFMTIGFWRWINDRCERISDWFDARSKQSFQSAEAALLWYEWHQKGLMLPLLISMFVAVALVGWLIHAIWNFEFGSTSDLIVAIDTCGGLLVASSLAAGLILGLGKIAGGRDESFSKMASNTSVYSMGQFQATRPMSSLQFANASLRTALGGVFIGWGIWTTVYVACNVAIAAWSGSAGSPVGMGYWIVPMVLIGSWAGITSVGAIMLTGRGSMILTCLIGALTIYAIGLIVLEATPWKNSTDRFQFVSAAILTIGFQGLAVWMLLHGFSRRMLSIRSIAIMIVAWIAIAGLIVLGAPSTFPWHRLMLAVNLGGLSVLPWVSFHLAIDWNRHR
jgi:hypothetical protein